jgi:hypothetical protein
VAQSIWALVEDAPEDAQPRAPPQNDAVRQACSTPLLI